jgi:hypothetical protein
VIGLPYHEANGHRHGLDVVDVQDLDVETVEKLMANLESKPDHLIAGAKKKSKKGTGKEIRGEQKAEIGD